MNERSHILSAPSHSPWSTPSPVRAEGGSFTLHGLWLWLPGRTAEEPGKVLLLQLGLRRGHR